MRLERTFILSMYATLVLACGCMSYALAPYLPEMGLIFWPAVVLFVVAYLREGKWSLSNLGANMVAVVIAIGAVWWLWSRYLEPMPGTFGESAILSVPLLPPMGGLLVVLILVKLFRPKRTGDYWWLHGTAFVAVALACIIGSEFFFAPLLMGYLACAIWSLSLFYLYRESQANPIHQLTTLARVPGMAGGLPWALRQTMLLAGIGLLLFFATPRAPLSATAKYRMQSGSSLDIDLNRTGTIHLSDEVAFEVKATRLDGTPMLDLDPHQRWRGATLNTYRRGRWWYRGEVPQRAGIVLPQPQEPSPDVQDLPYLGADQYFLTYRYSYQPRSRLVLADPIYFPAGKTRSPVVSFKGGKLYPWDRQISGDLSAPILSHYRQVTLPPQPGNLPPANLSGRQIDVLCRLPKMPELYDWTRKVLAQLVVEGRLTADEIKTDEHNIIPDWKSYERVSKALAAFLNSNDDYRYSLELRRHDDSIDPILDFLLNVKTGHCQRFASALTVMLRSQGIPSRIVVGFSGVESWDAGLYFVRRRQAHAWVEAAVECTGADGKVGRFWLPLDPTPSQEADAQAGVLVRWWRSFSLQAGGIWQTLFIDFQSDSQQALAMRVWSWLRSNPVVWFVGTTLLIWLIGRRLRRKGQESTDRPSLPGGFYGKWLRTIGERLQLFPEPGQTPLEFAGDVTRRLEASPSTAARTSLPLKIANLFYRVRFAGQSLTDSEQSEIDNDIQDFEAACVPDGTDRNTPQSTMSS